MCRRVLAVLMNRTIFISIPNEFLKIANKKLLGALHHQSHDLLAIQTEVFFFKLCRTEYSNPKLITKIDFEYLSFTNAHLKIDFRTHNYQQRKPVFLVKLNLNFTVCMLLKVTTYWVTIPLGYMK